MGDYATYSQAAREAVELAENAAELAGELETESGESYQSPEVRASLERQRDFAIEKAKTWAQIGAAWAQVSQAYGEHR